MSRALALNLIVVFCFCFNCFSVLENSQSLAQGNRLRVSLASESAKTVSGLAVLAAVLYVMIFSSTLSCISDVVFICFQCTVMSLDSLSEWSPFKRCNQNECKWCLPASHCLLSKPVNVAKQPEHLLVLM
ncbi:uncharacterized protein LOC142775520 isoform X2 [Rhipicephalus microplus]|uniref:uncharacterized protein LOC142775520 isoform X2 n=1 Tax=Rhipicephalus microplus TaxID=6941 RepID=UPI003F6D5992